MKTCRCGQSLKTATCAIASALAVASLAGCGASANFVQGVEPDANVSTLAGIVHGGPNSVIGATVILYATTTVSSPSSSNNYGYGQPGTVLAATTTDSSGNYTFTSPATCPAGQQAYIVASGGTSNGQQSSNSAALLMAAIGPCSSLSSSTYIFVNEASTIAAAYAIGQFMTVGTTSGPDGVPVDVSAPANNNAATPGCTVTAGRTTACQAAGLAHAFLNAANLVSPVGTATSLPSGFPNLETPNGSGLVPVLLINTLANSVEACVNSSGSGSAPCASLMADTQPAAALISPQPAAPTNTLQALLDLAQYPQPSKATAIFNIGFANAYYQPGLTSAPPDFALAIIYDNFYPIADTGSWNVTSDIADNIYTAGAAAGVFGTQAASMTSNGSHNWGFLTGDGTFPPTLSPCYSLSGGCGLATDTLGHLYVAAAGHIYQVNTTDGLGTGVPSNLTLSATPHGNNAAGVAVDQDNDVFATIWSGSGGGSTIQELLSGGTAWSDVQVNGANFTADVLYVTIDNGGNLWLSTPYTDCCSVYFIANSNVYPAAPSFTSSTATQIALNPGDTVGSTTMLDAQGNAWLADQDGLYEGAHAGFPAVMEVVPSGWFGGVVSQTAMDGDGKIAVSEDTANMGDGHYVGLWYPGGTGASSDASSAEVPLTPCVATLNSTKDAPGGVCAGSAGMTGTGIVIDDTGSIWVAIPTAPYDLVQVLGPGAPTWGQASFGKIGNGSGNIGSERPY